MSAKTKDLVRSMGFSIGFIELIHELVVANGPSHLEIMFTYFGSIANVVEQPFTAPKLLKTYGTKGKATDIGFPDVLEAMLFELVQAQLLESLK